MERAEVEEFLQDLWGSEEEAVGHTPAEMSIVVPKDSVPTQRGHREGSGAVPKGSKDKGRVVGTATNRSLGNTSLEGLRTPRQIPPHLQELLEVPNFNFPEETPY